MHALLPGLSLAALLVAAGPPWISIEYPVNPHDSSTRDAFLLVHTFHHGTPLGTTIEGTAEGIVSGERRTTRLEFSTTSRPGVYALRRTWGTEGVWTLVIRTSRDHGDGANAIVELASSGEIASVRVPTRRQGRWTIPSEVSMDDIERGLRARAS